MTEQLSEIDLPSFSLDRCLPLAGPEGLGDVRRVVSAVARRLQQRIVWNINSTASGGGVAEMLHSLIPYARSLGIDARWLVVPGRPAFFNVTKRIHHALHGEVGDGSPLCKNERDIYDRTLAKVTPELISRVRPGDIVLLHDPQTVGLAPVLHSHGVTVLWRCHIGTDTPNEHTERGWDFVAPYLNRVAAMIFSRKQYVPERLDAARAWVIPPSLDPLSPKNQVLEHATVRSILARTGLIAGNGIGAPATFLRNDGSAAIVERQAQVIRDGPAPGPEIPLVVQISRWDSLKDPIGVIQGFVSLLNGPDPVRADLLLAGPEVTSVADDPESRAVLERVIGFWRSLPVPHRRHIHLATLPTYDTAENAAIVNALQRHAAVIVQKSLKEGFGLTVTEAMWKARPIVASAVGGIREQIEHGTHGLLVADPKDLPNYGKAIRRLLGDVGLATRLGKQARERAQSLFLNPRHLGQYALLLQHVELGHQLTASST